MLVPTMENVEKIESSQRGKCISKIICVIWKIKRPSPFEGDAPSIYRNEGVKRAHNEVMRAVYGYTH